MSEWQPIETFDMPIIGGFITANFLVAWPDGYVCSCYFHSNGWVYENVRSTNTSRSYPIKRDAVNIARFPIPSPEMPTHWMSLPKPPSPSPMEQGA